MKKMRFRRLTALVMTVCMIGTIVPAPFLAYAVEDGGDTIEVTEFAPLQEEVAVRRVPLGVSSADLGLPSELMATVYSVSEDTAPAPPPEQEKPNDSDGTETKPEDDQPAQPETPPESEQPTEPEIPPTNEGNSPVTPEPEPPTDPVLPTDEDHAAIVQEQSAQIPTTSETVQQIDENDVPLVATPWDIVPDEPEVDVPAPETPKVDVPAPEAPEVDVPAPEAPEVDVPAPEAPEVDVPAPEAPEVDVPAPETPKIKTIAIQSVIWESTPLYDENNPGEYRFTAVLPERYILAEGVSLPEIHVTVYDSAKVISAWAWNDPDSLINEGVLALPGVNAENPIDMDTLLSMLPASINATLDTQAAQDSGEVDNTPVSVALTWSSKDFVQAEDGSLPVQGNFLFTATMQEGYTLAEGAPALEIAVQLGGAMLLPDTGVFHTLEIREGTATGTVIVNLLDPSATSGWALKPGTDYYLCADLIAPSGSEYIQIHYGGTDSYNGVTFANPPGGKYEPNKFTTHDYLDELVSYKDFPNPSYGSASTQYPLQDGEMIYHIKEKVDDAAKNTAFAIGLVVKDAVYDGSCIITDAIKIAVGSYVMSTEQPQKPHGY